MDVYANHKNTYNGMWQKPTQFACTAIHNVIILYYMRGWNLELSRVDTGNVTTQVEVGLLLCTGRDGIIMSVKLMEGKHMTHRLTWS